MRRHYIKQLRFEEKVRSKLTFSDATKIRLNPLTNQLELKKDSLDKYPTDADLYMAGPLWNPEALTKWEGLHVDPLEENQPAGTTVGLRLGDGTDQRYWGGASWDVASPGDWSTETEVAANITSFPLTGKQLQLIVNLRTTDNDVTPTVSGLCVLMEADFDYLASIIGDSLVPSLAASFGTLVIDFALVVDAGGVNLSLLDLETPFNLVDVLEVYNHDTDPEHLTDIFSAFDSAGKQITVSSAFAVGETAWLKISVAPEIIVNWASQDYIEISKVPAVVIERIDANGNQVTATAVVRDKSASPPTATVMKTPYKLQLNIALTLVGEKTRTLMALQDRALTHAIETPLLRWRALEEELTLTTASEGEFRPRPDLRDEHSSSYSLRLHDVYLWLKPSEQINLVEQVNLGFVRQT